MALRMMGLILIREMMSSEMMAAVMLAVEIL